MSITSTTFKPPYDALWGFPVLEKTDWSIEISAYGDGSDTQSELSKIAPREAAPESTRYHLQSAVVHQSTLFPVVEPTTRFLLPLCAANLSLRHSLLPFWEEWLDGVDMIEPCTKVSEDLLAKTRETIRQTIAEDSDNFDSLFEDMEESAPISVMMRHTNYRANCIRPLVIQLYPSLAPQPI